MGVVPSEFFEERQGAAVLKHGILQRYLTIFTAKLGLNADDHKVYFLDAYAGPGEYAGGDGGSPAIAAASAAALANNRNLFGIYVEEDDENFEKLEKFLANTEHEHRVLHGSIEDNIDEVLAIVGTAPLLAFIDPFGLPVPMEQLRRLLERPKKPGSLYPPPTELIIHVSYTGIARLCGMLTSKAAEMNPSKAKQRDTIVANCDAQLGGDWWRQIARDRAAGVRPADGPDWREEIAHGYAQQIRELTGRGWFRVQVRDRHNGPVSYELLLVTAYSSHAHWVFHDVVSLATHDFRLFSAQKEAHKVAKKAAAKAAKAGQETFAIPVPEVTLPDETEQWVAAIKANIVGQLKIGEFVVRERMVDVYGTTFGLARETHVRTAIKQLFKEQITTCNGISGSGANKIPVPEMRITRGPKAPPPNPPVSSTA